MGLFKACDIRGVVGDELTHEMAARIAAAIGVTLSGQRVVVGGDNRVSTPELKRLMMKGLAGSGCEVLDIGMVATPVFYYALHAAGASGGVMVTASHNPAAYNGFKLILGDQPVDEAAIAGIAALVERHARVRKPGLVRRLDVIDGYIAALAGKAAPGKMKVVLDAGNGAASLLAPRLFRRLGYEVVELFCEPDGRFPNRPPNPALPENLGALEQKVRQTGAALGVAFDGDGDRAAFVDETGRAVDNDDILILLARRYLERAAGTVVYDAKCSMTVPEQIAAAGGEPVMARAGHTFIKAEFLRRQAVFAGEISGHFFFRELGNDDGLFSGLRICEYVARHGALSKLIDAIPNYVLTPEVRVRYTGGDKDAILRSAAARLAGEKLNLIDGVRLEYADGWGMIRSSVTEPLFTFRFEAKTGARLREITARLLSAVPDELAGAVRGKLASGFGG